MDSETYSLDANEEEEFSYSQQNPEDQEEQQNSEEEEQQSEEEEQQQLDFASLSQHNYFESILQNNGGLKKDYEKFLQKKELLKKNKNLSEIETQLIERDQQDQQTLMEELKEQIFEISQKIPKVSQSPDGISFLTAKNSLFNAYLMLLHFYMLFKISAKSISGTELVKKAIYIKTLIGKLKPVEKKLEYQINKLMKLTINPEDMNKNTKDELETDPLQFKPRPGQLEPKEQQQQGGKSKYKAPKFTAVLQNDDAKDERSKKQEERRIQYLKRQHYNDIMDDLDTEKPIQQVDKVDKFQRQKDAKTLWEEDNYQRLPTTRAEKKAEKRRTKTATKLERIDDMTEFQQIGEILKHDKLIEGKNDDNVKSNNFKRKSSKFGGPKRGKKMKKH